LEHLGRLLRGENPVNPGVGMKKMRTENLEILRLLRGKNSDDIEGILKTRGTSNLKI
jgi:hypothetical protein